MISLPSAGHLIDELSSVTRCPLLVIFLIMFLNSVFVLFVLINTWFDFSLNTYMKFVLKLTSVLMISPPV